jgi:lipid A 3-O-deacylase
VTAAGRAGAFVLLALLGPQPGWPQEAAAPAGAGGPADPSRPGALFALSAGQFNIANQQKTAVEAGVQWRGGGRWWVLHPIAGAAVTDEGAFNAYLGFTFDLPTRGTGFVARPSFAPGYYHQGGGKDLGDALEFRSGLELGWRFGDGTRVGVELHHLSNASLGRINPGENTLLLVVSFPARRLFGR